MRAPNVLFVVWDACRLDAARRHAPTLSSLAADNLRFENAVTPAGYSLPAHVSLATGEYPHEHGTYSPEHTADRAPLLEAFADREYRRYAVSANGFASAMYGFDRHFDEFYNTQGQMVYPTGLDVHGYAGRVRDEDGSVSARRLGGTDLFREVLGHERPVRSAVNVAAAALTQAVRAYPVLERVPHRRFSRLAEFAYSPERNTRTIERVLDAESERDGPFFLFTNYMDAHHPYAPPREYQEAVCDRTYGLGELRRLAERTHPLEFVARHRSGERLDERTVDAARRLYAGEVRRADAHLGRLLAALEERGLREETLVVVTADHGENLGETDAMGETRFGHVLSASDDLLRVPLVVAHPDLSGRRVTDHVSTKDLLSACLDPETVLASGGRDLGPLAADGPVAAELPAYVNDALWERYPDLRELLARSISVAYEGKWKVVATSAGEERAWRDGDERPPGDAPVAVRETAGRHLRALPTESVTGRGLPDEAVTHLEALGYL